MIRTIFATIGWTACASSILLNWALLTGYLTKADDYLTQITQAQTELRTTKGK